MTNSSFFLIPTDIFKKDFLKNGGDFFELETKNSPVAGVTLTSNTTMKSSDGTVPLTTSLSAKWAHPSGFTLDKINFKGVGHKIEVENSLENVIPDLKLEFKGDDHEKGELLATYKVAPATVKATFDIMKQAKGELSVATVQAPFTVGGILSFETKEKVTTTDVSASAAYSAGPIFAGIISSKMFKSFELLSSYAVSKEISVAAKVEANDKGKGFGFKTIAGATYKCNPNTFIKGKIDSDATLDLSVTQKVDKNLSVSVWAQTKFPAAATPSFGIKAVLGN